MHSKLVLCLLTPTHTKCRHAVIISISKSFSEVVGSFRAWHHCFYCWCQQYSAGSYKMIMERATHKDKCEVHSADCDSDQEACSSFDLLKSVCVLTSTILNLNRWHFAICLKVPSLMSTIKMKGRSVLFQAT